MEVSRSKNNSLKTNATFDENFQIFGPYYVRPINTAQRNLSQLRAGVKRADKVVYISTSFPILHSSCERIKTFISKIFKK